MRALHAVRTTPARAALRVRIAQAGDREAGMATAEYAVATVAACGFAGVLATILKSPEVLDFVKDVILGALKGLF